MKKLKPRKTLKYLSYTSYSLFKKDPEKFYATYIAGLPRSAQTAPMAIGSAFDSKVKKLLVKDFDDAGYIKGISIEHRDTVLKDADTLIDIYSDSGALNQLVKVIGGRECKVEEALEGDICYEGRCLRIMGKPDLYFYLEDGTLVILDWKVNGFYSKASPRPGFVNLYSKTKGWSGEHKTAIVGRHGDINISMSGIAADDWRQQLMMYSWLAGLPVGAKSIGCIDQFACNSDKKEYRIAQHRAYLPKDEQIELFHDMCNVWDMINSQAFLDKYDYLNDDAGELFI